MPFLSRNRITIEFAKGFLINFIGFYFTILCCLGSIYSKQCKRPLSPKKKNQLYNNRSAAKFTDFAIGDV